MYFANNNGDAPIDLAAMVGDELQVVSGVTVTGNVMNNGTTWSVTYVPASNNFTNTGGGVACS